MLMMTMSTWGPDRVLLKSLLQQGLSESEFYGDLVYKFRKIYACNDFSTQFRKMFCVYHSRTKDEGCPHVKSI